MPLHHDIVSRCCDCFNCPLPVTTLIWGTAIKMKCWSFIFTTSSVTLLLFWRCKRFFPVAYSHTKMAATVKNLTFTDEELPLHVLVGYKQKRKAKALIGRLWKQSGMSSTKSFYRKISQKLSGKVSARSLQTTGTTTSLILSSFCNQRRKLADRLTSLTKGA